MINWIISGLLLAAAFFALRYVIKQHKEGKCAGGCAGCSGGCHCHGEKREEPR